MDIKDVIIEIKRQGVTARFKGGTLAVLNIPSWATYIYIEEHIDALLLIAVAKQVFGTVMAPIEFKAERDNKCIFCGNYNLYRCVYEKAVCRIPSNVLKYGCEHFTDNGHGVFF